MDFKPSLKGAWLGHVNHLNFGWHQPYLWNGWSPYSRQVRWTVSVVNWWWSRSPVHHSDRRHLCTTWWAWGTASRGSVSCSGEWLVPCGRVSWLSWNLQCSYSIVFVARVIRFAAACCNNDVLRQWLSNIHTTDLRMSNWEFGTIEQLLAVI